LPEAFRVVFVLRAVEGLSVDETAACLGLVPETVRTRFFRARGTLRQALLERGELLQKDVYAFHARRCDRVVARSLGRISSQSWLLG
jgi:RNA polymerase sigma-70 factor (ECF subfamily)